MKKHLTKEDLGSVIYKELSSFLSLENYPSARPTIVDWIRNQIANPKIAECQSELYLRSKIYHQICKNFEKTLKEKNIKCTFEDGVYNNVVLRLALLVQDPLIENLLKLYEDTENNAQGNLCFADPITGEIRPSNRCKYQQSINNSEEKGEMKVGKIESKNIDSGHLVELQSLLGFDTLTPVSTATSLLGYINHFEIAFKKIRDKLIDEKLFHQISSNYIKTIKDQEIQISEEDARKIISFAMLIDNAEVESLLEYYKDNNQNSNQYNDKIAWDAVKAWEEEKKQPEEEKAKEELEKMYQEAIEKAASPSKNTKTTFTESDKGGRMTLPDVYESQKEEKDNIPQINPSFERIAEINGKKMYHFNLLADINDQLTGIDHLFNNDYITENEFSMLRKHKTKLLFQLKKHMLALCVLDEEETK